MGDEIHFLFNRQLNTNTETMLQYTEESLVSNVDKWKFLYNNQWPLNLEGKISDILFSIVFPWLY